ncbi:MAG: hypothetical protein IJQ11_09340 [Bacteroidales bacterium]|nr:hypothetical protein [Bacteroidales bacterium]
MKPNITTDNYEAYLLDYVEGNLSPEGAEELRQFVAVQGLDWDELTAPLPYLEVPQVAYEDKERLKKKATVVPLYVKIASAAAAAGLLLTVSLWPEKSMPKVEPIAELKPILPGRLITASETTTTLPPRTIQFVHSQVVRKEKTTIAGTTSEVISRPVSDRVETPLMAQLEPQKAQTLPTSTSFDEPDPGLMANRMNTHLALAQIEANGFDDFSYDEDDDRELSLIGKGLLWLTNGRHNSFASLIGAGVSKAKQDLAEAATDMALAAYSNFNEQIEEAKERWDEKREE